jgi:Fusaric acid resistance protein-like
MSRRDKCELRGNLRSSGSYLGDLRWRELVRVGPLRWGDVAPWRAARVAVGVVVPLAIGSATGHLDYGAFAALGAQPAGLVSFHGEARSRLTAVAVASVGMAASTFVGATTATAAPWLLVPFVIVLGYICGLMVCLGPRLSVATLQWALALLVAVGLPLGPGAAGVRAGLVLAGGLFQGVLVAGSWVLRRGEAERETLASSYRALASYASGVAAGRSEPPPPIAFAAAAALADPNPLLPASIQPMFLDLLEEAERIRASLAAMAAHTADAHQGEAEQLRSLTADAAAVLGLIAVALSARRGKRAERLPDLSGGAPVLAVAPDASWRWAAEALFGQLRAVVGLVGRLDAVATEASPTAEARSTQPQAPGATAAVATLRANVNASSEAGRHALRLAVAAGLAEVLAQATGLRDGRWVVLTVFIVLKPDYNSTVYRSVQRAAGTMLGAGLGAAAAQLGHLGHGELIAVAGVVVAAAYALFDVSFLFYSVFLTTFIVLLLEMLGVPAVPTAGARAVDTAIGAGLVIAVYFAWPTWEAVSARENFARVLERHGEYASALLRQLAHPGRFDAAQLRAVQVAARGARSDAEASAARLSDEPSLAPLTPDLARALITTVRQLAHAELALHALAVSQEQLGRQSHDVLTGDDADALDALGASLATTMSALAVSLRTLQPQASAPTARPVQAALKTQWGVNGTFRAATDGMVDAVGRLDALVRDRLVWPRAGERSGRIGAATPRGAS